MVSLVLRNGRWQCLHGQKARRTIALGAIEEKEAQEKAAQVDYPLMRIKRRPVAVSPNDG
jgi:hypothetical protein